MYKLTEDKETVIRLSDGAFIPVKSLSNHGQEYREWLAKGNTPESVDYEIPEERTSL